MGDDQMKTRVRLRRLTEKNATKEYANWFKDKELRRWITHATPTVEACRDYIRKALADPNVLLWGIFVDRRHIGNIKAEFRIDQAVLGLLVGDPKMRGCGIGTAAIRQAARWCYRHWKVGRVTAGVHPFNIRSVRVFEKCGFRPLLVRLWLEKKR